MADLQLYLANPHYAQDDDFSEAVERLDHCDAEAARHYRDVQVAAQTKHTRAVHLIPDPHGSPRWARARDAADREFSRTMKAAHELRIQIREELFLTGEMSSASDEALTALLPPNNRPMPNIPVGYFDQQATVARIFAEPQAAE
jgi:hypothetical protein